MVAKHYVSKQIRRKEERKKKKGGKKKFKGFSENLTVDIQTVNRNAQITASVSSPCLRKSH